MTGIAENLQAVRARLGAARGVILLAVSKGHGIDKVREARAAGQKAFGENYVQEALAKVQALPDLEWHLIGPLQSNKTRAAAEHFAWVQTIDREKVAQRLSEQRPEALPPLNVLIQVNASGETSKSGEIAALRVEDIALRDELVRRLEAAQYNVSQVARDMGKARQQIQRWMRRFGLREKA